MIKNSKSLLIIIMITTIIIVPSGYSAGSEEKISEENIGEPSSFDYFIDTIVWRPLGLCATVIGTGLFVVYLPFSIPTKTVSETKEKLVVAPFDFTFKRPWGDEP